MNRLLACVAAGLIALCAPSQPATAQTPPGQPGGADLAAMLGQAQRFTVKVRGTVLWPLAPEQLGTGLGTGFIIDRDKGWILTNAHVAKRSPAAVEVAVGEAEGDWITADRIYLDNHLDVAVIRVAPERLPADALSARLGCTEAIRQGASVVAYGHPINLSFTATRGIVSSVRTLGAQEFVQMDANINPGNSGGPLLAVDAAAVIGINTANIAGATGLGLALSIRHVCPIVDMLAAGQDPSVPSLPVYWLKQGRVETLAVAARFPSSQPPVDGLRPGDVVQGFSGGPRVATLPDLYAGLRGRTAAVRLDVLRDGAVTQVTETLIAARPALKRQVLIVAGMLVTERPALDTLDIGLPGLRVEFVRAGEHAARAGVQPWDQLDRVGDQRFSTVDALHAWLSSRPAGAKVVWLMRRGSMLDPRVTADYHRIDLAPTDMRVVSAGD